MDNQIMWSPGVTLEDIEKQVILKAFRFYRGSKTTTSQALGISIRTLDTKLEKYEADGKLAKQQQDEQRQRDLDFFARQRGDTGLVPQPNTSKADEERQREKVLSSTDARLRVEPPVKSAAKS